MADQILEWSWGESKFIGRVKVFDTLEIEGGYMCLFCGLKLNKRWDCLTGHIAKCKNKPEGFDKAQIEKIPRIKVMCAYCHLPFDMTGTKEARHLKTCKGFVEQRKKQVVKNNTQLVDVNQVMVETVRLEKDMVENDGAEIDMLDKNRVDKDSVVREGENKHHGMRKRKLVFEEETLVEPNSFVKYIKTNMNVICKKVEDDTNDWEKKEKKYLKQIELLKTKQKVVDNQVEEDKNVWKKKEEMYLEQFELMKVKQEEMSTELQKVLDTNMKQR